MHDYQQFSILAKSFLQGKLYFIQEYSSWWHDAVEFAGQHYWPLGPFPAILLMPFQILWGEIFYQGYLQWFLVFGVLIIVFAIARKLKYSKSDSLYLSAAFCFASAFLGVAFWPNSWFFSQVITVLLVCLALNEFLGKRRYWLIGLLWAMVLTSRITAAIGIVFFLVDIFSKKQNRLFSLVNLSLPITAATLFLGWYNFARFGNPLEQGYSMQLAAGNFSGALAHGLFSIVHIPGNLYYLFLSVPQPVVQGEWSHVLISPFLKADPWGISIFVTSPYLLYLFFVSFKQKISKALLLTCAAIALPIVFYYGIGWYQFGYRYSLDFLPFLFLAFLIAYKQKNHTISGRLKILIVLSSFFNLYLFSNLFLI